MLGESRDLPSDLDRVARDGAIRFAGGRTAARQERRHGLHAARVCDGGVVCDLGFQCSYCDGGEEEGFHDDFCRYGLTYGLLKFGSISGVLRGGNKAAELKSGEMSLG